VLPGSWLIRQMGIHRDGARWNLGEPEVEERRWAVHSAMVTVPWLMFQTSILGGLRWGHASSE
jgi:hypothetical protein